MKKTFKRIILLGLSAVMLTSVLPGTIAASAAAVENDNSSSSEYEGLASGCEEIDFSTLSDDEIISSVEDYMEFSGDSAPIVGSAASALPEECDNSTNENSIYCPPIGDQGSVFGCACWSATYYNYTYTAHRAYGIPTTENNIFSPIWIYNLSNSGLVQGGSNSPRNYNIIRTMGALTVEDVPIINNPYPEQGIFNWHAENGLWKKALSNRLTTFGYFTPETYVEEQYPCINTPVAPTGTPVTSADDSDLAALKTAISNGEVLCFNSYVYDWDEVRIKSAPGIDNRFAGEIIVRGCKGTDGAHGMVIVGYNDNVWTDINDNNKVDSGEMGAFKAANSWGTRYGNKGFYWIAYDSLNKVSAVNGAPYYANRQPSIDTVSTIKVDPIQYESGVYLKYVLKSSERASTHVYVTAINKADRSNYVTKLVPPYGLDDYVNYVDLNEDHSYKGTTTADYGEMYYDLNNVVPGLDISKVNDYEWNIQIIDRTNNGKPLTICEVKIIDDFSGGEYDILKGQTYTINGSSKIFYANNVTFPSESDDNSVTIYYKGYSNPNIHYQVGNGNWTNVPGIAMAATNEVSGYTHKYKIDLGTSSYANVCFNNGAGSWDSNNGSNYRFEKGCYKYSNGTITKYDPTPAGISADLSVSKSEALKNETITLNASAANGKAPYQYKLSYTLNGVSYNYVDYSSNSEFTFTPIMTGNYVFTLTAKDANGKTATATKTFAAKYPSITSVDTSKPSAKTGETVKISMTVADNMSSMTRSYKITKGGVTNTLSSDSTGAASWTPSEAGEYTITGILTYNGKTFNSSSITYTVSEAPSNKAVIYYKGYSTPYIHYQVGNGSWTNAPGFAMTATSEVSGYTHKYTIDLGSSTYANVCFNNGSGSWDSNNGSNYRFEKGTYKYSNGTITKFDPTPAGLAANLSLSKSEVLKDEAITINVSASNGKAPYYYKLSYTLDGVEHGFTDFCSSTKFTFAPDQKGNYVFTLTAKDSTGKTATATKKLTAKAPSITSVNTSTSSAKTGETVRLSMNVADNMSSMTRSYKITKGGVTNTLSADSSGAASWTPNEAGEYTITGILTYNGTTYDSTSISYTVTEAPANKAVIYYKGYSTPFIHYQVGNGNWTSVPGVAMTATNEVSGYTHKYTINLGTSSYANVCFNNGSNNWDSNNGSNYRFEKGTYKYSNGTITKFDPTPAGLTANLSVSKSEALKNETITLNASAANGKAPYQYKLSYTLDGVSYNYVDYSSNSEFTFTPIMTGNYVFTLTAKDADGKTATATKSFAAKMPSISSVNTSTTSGRVGETVSLSMNVADNMSSMTRSYTITKGAVATTLSEGSNGAASWTPHEAGTYTITGVLTYNGRIYNSKSITYTVSEALANTITIYYKGYSTPYIHYQVGNGNWTSVPGVAMTATNEVSGYTHKYTINLGTATYANVCFNDGKGNWDSRNGANYFFEKGTYKFSNGNITKM